MKYKLISELHGLDKKFHSILFAKQNDPLSFSYGELSIEDVYDDLNKFLKKNKDYKIDSIFVEEKIGNIFGSVEDLIKYEGLNPVLIFIKDLMGIDVRQNNKLLKVLMERVSPDIINNKSLDMIIKNNNNEDKKCYLVKNEDIIERLFNELRFEEFKEVYKIIYRTKEFKENQIEHGSFIRTKDIYNVDKETNSFDSFNELITLISKDDKDKERMMHYVYCNLHNLALPLYRDRKEALKKYIESQDYFDYKQLKSISETYSSPPDLFGFMNSLLKTGDFPGLGTVIEKSALVVNVNKEMMQLCKELINEMWETDPVNQLTKMGNLKVITEHIVNNHYDININDNILENYALEDIINKKWESLSLGEDEKENSKQKKLYDNIMSWYKEKCSVSVEKYLINVDLKNNTNVSTEVVKKARL